MSTRWSPSTLPINENQVSAGLLVNPTAQFLFSAQIIPDVGGATVTPGYNPNTDPNVLTTVVNGKTVAVPSGNITVNPGATLASPTNIEHVGGRIALIAPTVTNQGVISTPDGQTILAAGQQVGFVAHPSADPSQRGLDVTVGMADATDAAINDVSGFIDAHEPT